MPLFLFVRFFIIDRTDFFYFHVFICFSHRKMHKSGYRSARSVYSLRRPYERIVSVRLISAGYFVLRSGSCTRWASSRLNHGTFF